MIIYNLAILLYQFGVWVASFFNEKAKQFHDGRVDLLKKLKDQVDGNAKYIWVHAASLGEFEQGRPIIERIKREHPEYKIILTFFSPSGYEVRKNYDQADIVCYMPLDTICNVKKFLDTVNPSIVIFIKYEFWMNYLFNLRKRRIPTYIVSAIFREEQAFFKWYGFFYKKVLKCFNRLFVQDANSIDLLRSIGINNATIAGDTRFDRVCEIVKQAKDIPQIAAFKGDKKVLIAGSSWQPDEDLLCEYFNNNDGFKMILAPHVTSEAHVEEICKKLNKKYARFTKSTEEEIKEADCLIIDCIGILTSVYKYGDVGYVGGGFGVGIHNILEPAVYGMPIFFGPNYKKFREAVDMVKSGAAFPINNKQELFPLLNEMFDENQNTLSKTSSVAKAFVREHCGATDIVMKEIFK